MKYLIDINYNIFFRNYNSKLLFIDLLLPEFGIFHTKPIILLITFIQTHKFNKYKYY